MNSAVQPARLLDSRRSGVLLHPTALIGATGDPQRGALGAAARSFIDWVAQAGFSIWQVLPLGPPGGGGSPYWARSDAAGQITLIDQYERPDAQAQAADYAAFRDANRDWLEDYVLFETLAARFHAAWWDWPLEFRTREPAAMRACQQSAVAELEQRRLEQWHFDWQWRALRDYALQRGVHLFGDLPIYVAPDSVATWSQRAQFQLDADGRPAERAGVPPDYFSVDGQLWGNPLYNWEQAGRDGFAFWRTRLGHQLRRFDLVRIDHFRGLAGYWSVPAGATTARDGRWCPAPGKALFEALRAQFGELPVIAEDLGVITPDVEELRVQYGLPGMRVLQFGFDGSPTNPHLPHNFRRDVVAYTGTHDNDTTVGWLRELDHDAIGRVQFYLRSTREALPEAMLGAVLASVAGLAIIPLQDLLQLGGEARFNKPGTVEGNWNWRCSLGSLDGALAERLAALNHVYGRISSRGGA